jgi:hypothetical protein
LPSIRGRVRFVVVRIANRVSRLAIRLPTKTQPTPNDVS